MKKAKIYLLISFLVIVSCKHTNTLKIDIEKTEKVVELPYFIDLEKNLNKIKPITLSSIGKELEYIPLETNANSLLRNIYQIVFSDSYIFISDFNKLLQFDRNGKFVRQVGANGRGPGEYINVSGFCIDEKKETVYIIAWGIHTVLEFGFNGKFIRSFNKSFESLQFLVNDTNSFVFRLETKVTNDYGFKLYLTDLKGTPLVKIKNYSRRTSKPALILSITPMYFFNDNIQFMQFGVDTLYTLKNEKLEPYAIFNLGKMKMDPDPMIPSQNLGKDDAFDQLKQKLWINKISENVQYLFLGLNYGFSDSSTTCIINKLTLETSFLEDNSFKNDIDGAINFWPKYVYNDSILVDYCEAYVLLNYIHSWDTGERKRMYGDKYLQLEKLGNELKETSNPVLIILKPR